MNANQQSLWDSVKSTEYKLWKSHLRGKVRTSHLDPFSLAERRAISAQIRGEIADAAVEILKVEQETKDKLHAVHIKCVSLMVLATVGLGISVVYLRVVLVPFILAIFFMFLLEPLLFALLSVPRCLKRTTLVDAFMQSGGHRDRQGQAPNLRSDASVVDRDFQEACGSQVATSLLSISRTVWNLVCVVTCMLTLLGLSFFVCYFIVQAFQSIDWNKYKKSHKFKLVMDVFPERLATNPDDLDLEMLLPWLLQGPLFNALDIAFSVISQTALMLLFLAFLLANDINSEENVGDDSWQIGTLIRFSVRRYIRIKTNLAFIVCMFVGGLLWYLAVDLFFVFAVLTFVLYYIPHVGNTVAVIAPLPIVFLDPNMTWGNLAVVFVIPFTIHQLAVNLVEPKLVASSLDLHPIVVLISLAFWTTVWGAMGAVLSVPLTAVIRLVLLEMDHPYAKPLVWILKGDTASSPKAKSLQEKMARRPTSSIQGGSLRFREGFSPESSGDRSPNGQSSSSRSDDPSPPLRPPPLRFLNHPTGETQGNAVLHDSLGSEWQKKLGDDLLDSSLDERSLGKPLDDDSTGFPDNGVLNEKEDIRALNWNSMT